MLENTPLYCDWISYQSELLFYGVNLGLAIGAFYGLIQARKNHEYGFPIMLLALLALRLTLEFNTNINALWIDALSIFALSLGFFWIYFKNITTSYKRPLIGGLQLLLILTALNTFSSLENHRIYLWFIIAFNVIFWYQSWWRRLAALAIGSIWLLIPAIAPTPELCSYFNMMWVGSSLVSIVALIKLSPNTD